MGIRATRGIFKHIAISWLLEESWFIKSFFINTTNTATPERANKQTSHHFKDLQCSVFKSLRKSMILQCENSKVYLEYKSMRSRSTIKNINFLCLEINFATLSSEEEKWLSLYHLILNTCQPKRAVPTNSTCTFIIESITNSNSALYIYFFFIFSLVTYVLFITSSLANRHGQMNANTSHYCE